MELVNNALEEGRRRLSEFESKRVLASYQIPVTREILVESSSDVIPAAHEIHYPVVMKGCSPEIMHKTERGLVQTDIRNDGEALDAFNEIMARMHGIKGAVLVQEMPSWCCNPSHLRNQFIGQAKSIDFCLVSL
jgi:acyl-CoA synthetase (NDP forming)